MERVWPTLGQIDYLLDSNSIWIDSSSSSNSSAAPLKRAQLGRRSDNLCVCVCVKCRLLADVAGGHSEAAIDLWPISSSQTLAPLIQPEVHVQQREPKKMRWVCFTVCRVKMGLTWFDYILGLRRWRFLSFSFGVLFVSLAQASKGC